MRSLRMAFLLGTAAMFLAGCSAGRAISNPFASTNSSAVSGGYSEYANGSYDNDPPAQSSRVAIEPSPVPPARGISLTKTISLTQTVGRRRRLDQCAQNPTCTAPAPSCVAPAQCGTACRPAPACSQHQGRGLFGNLCHRNAYCPKQTCCAPQATCGMEPSCCVPQRSCRPAEPSCCVPQQRCEPQCHAPQYARVACRPAAPQCAPQPSGRGLFGKLFGCVANPGHGAYCKAGCTQATCAVPACGSEGCGGNGCCDQGCGSQGCGSRSYNNHGYDLGDGDYVLVPRHLVQQHISNPPNRRQPETRTDVYQYSRTPLSNPMEDPFAQPAVSPDQEATPKSPVPEPPAAAYDQEPIPPSPSVGQPENADVVPTAPQPVPLQPMPSAGDNQTWVEPSPWGRLGTPSTTSVAVQPRTHNAWSTGWSR